MRTRIIYLLLFIVINLGIAFKFQWLFYEKEGVYHYLLIALLALINPVLVYLFLKNREWKGLIAFASFFVFAFIHTLIHEQYTEHQLDDNGEERWGIVTDKKWSKGTHGKQGEWLYRGMFEYKNIKYYTYFESLHETNINVNDSILILFSTHNPEINRFLMEIDDKSY